MGQREMAARALTAVSAMKGGENISELKTLCKIAPSLLIQSGLAQTVSFIRSRGAFGTKYLEHMLDVLKRSGLESAQLLQERALSVELQEYMELSKSVQDAMIWLRRFAQVELANIPDTELPEHD